MVCSVRRCEREGCRAITQATTHLGDCHLNDLRGMSLDHKKGTLSAKRGLRKDVRTNGEDGEPMRSPFYRQTNKKGFQKRHSQSASAHVEKAKVGVPVITGFSQLSCFNVGEGVRAETSCAGSCLGWVLEGTVGSSVFEGLFIVVGHFEMEVLIFVAGNDSWKDIFNAII